MIILRDRDRPPWPYACLSGPKPCIWPKRKSAHETPSGDLLSFVLSTSLPLSLYIPICHAHFLALASASVSVRVLAPNPRLYPGACWIVACVARIWGQQFHLSLAWLSLICRLIEAGRWQMAQNASGAGSGT